VVAQPVGAHSVGGMGNFIRLKKIFKTFFLYIESKKRYEMLINGKVI
jgi:hypothetical protein